MPPKIQKATLLDQVDKAIGALGKEKIGPGKTIVVPSDITSGKGGEANYSTTGGVIKNAISFQLGKTKYNIANNREALSNFRRQVASGFPINDSPKIAASRAASVGPLVKRIKGEGVAYDNDYSPKRVTLDPFIKGNEDEKAILTSDGFVTNGHALIKPLTKPSGSGVNKNLNIKMLLSGKSFPVTEMREIKDMHREEAVIQFKGSNGNEIYAQPKYVDAIYTAYPNAKAKIQDEYHGIIFKNNGSIVGIVLPLK